MNQSKIKFLENKLIAYLGSAPKAVMDHLIGTAEILKSYGASDYLIDAGLFHSIYGTAVFHHQTTADRSVVQSVIGEKAEHLAYLFCILGRETDRKTEIAQINDKETRRELMLIDYANSEEQGSRKEMTWAEAYNV